LRAQYSTLQWVDGWGGGATHAGWSSETAAPEAATQPYASPRNKRSKPDRPPSLGLTPNQPPTCQQLCPRAVAQSCGCR
jgi:hypothetical protein